MSPIDSFLVYTVVACIYNRSYNTDDYSLLPLAKSRLQEENCFGIVDSVLKLHCDQDKADEVVNQLSVKFGLDSLLCDKIKRSQGLRRVVLCDIHDAGIAEAYVDGTDVVMVFDLNSGHLINGSFYRKVMKILFQNASKISAVQDLGALLGCFVCSHYESVEQGQLKIAFNLVNRSNDTEINKSFSICCDAVITKFISVKDAE